MGNHPNGTHYKEHEMSIATATPETSIIYVQGVAADEFAFNFRVSKQVAHAPGWKVNEEVVALRGNQRFGVKVFHEGGSIRDLVARLGSNGFAVHDGHGNNIN